MVALFNQYNTADQGAFSDAAGAYAITYRSDIDSLFIDTTVPPSIIFPILYQRLSQNYFLMTMLDHTEDWPDMAAPGGQTLLHTNMEEADSDGLAMLTRGTELLGRPPQPDVQISIVWDSVYQAFVIERAVLMEAGFDMTVQGGTVMITQRGGGRGPRSQFWGLDFLSWYERRIINHTRDICAGYNRMMAGYQPKQAGFPQGLFHILKPSPHTESDADPSNGVHGVSGDIVAGTNSYEAWRNYSYAGPPIVAGTTVNPTGGTGTASGDAYTTNTNNTRKWIDTSTSDYLEQGEVPLFLQNVQQDVLRNSPMQSPGRSTDQVMWLVGRNVMDALRKSQYYKARYQISNFEIMERPNEAVVSKFTQTMTNFMGREKMGQFNIQGLSNVPDAYKYFTTHAENIMMIGGITVVMLKEFDDVVQDVTTYQQYTGAAAITAAQADYSSASESTNVGRVAGEYVAPFLNGGTTASDQTFSVEETISFKDVAVLWNADTIGLKLRDMTKHTMPPAPNQFSVMLVETLTGNVVTKQRNANAFVQFRFANTEV